MIRQTIHRCALIAVAGAIVVFTARDARAGGIVTQCENDTDFSNKLVGGGTVSFDCGTATIVLSSTKEINSFVTIEGGGTITLSGDNARRLFIVNDRARLELHDIVIEKGFSKNGNGGAIYNLDTISISNTTFRNNATTSAWSGGAIYSSSHLAMAFSTFISNEAGSGGAIYAQSAINQTNIYATTFDQNFATEATTTGLGGALFVSDGATASVNLSTFTNNEARTGGAIAAKSGARLFVNGSTINDNTTTRDGGGIDVDVSTVMLTNSTMSRNFGQQGGAINTFAGEVTLTGVTLSGNTAYYGAGFQIFLGTHVLTNVTFSGNEASSSAGAIYNGRSKLTLVNVTLAGNTGSNGNVGGILNVAGGPSPDLRMKNVLIAKGATGDNCGFYHPATSLDANLSDDATCGFGPGRDNVDLMLGPLDNNSGATQTHLPNPGSPAIDGGTNNGCPSTDQRGLARPFGVVCDVGAVEVGPATPTPTRTTTRTATPTPSATTTSTRTTTPSTTRSATRTATHTGSPTPTNVATATQTATRTTTLTPTPIPTASTSYTATRTATVTRTASRTATFATPAPPTATASRTSTGTSTTTAGQTPSRTQSATATQPTTATPSVSIPGTGTPSPSATATAPAALCIGDCDNSQRVTINELVLMVNIALERQPLSACPAADGDGSGATTVQEILVGVNNAQKGCANAIAP